MLLNVCLEDVSELICGEIICLGLLFGIVKSIHLGLIKGFWIFGEVGLLGIVLGLFICVLGDKNDKMFTTLTVLFSFLCKNFVRNSVNIVLLS